MTPTELVLSRLSDAKPSGKGWVACCPAHEDRRPSLSVAEGDKGGAVLDCKAGCDTTAVCAALGLTLADLMPSTATTSTVNPKGPRKQEYRRHGRAKPRGRAYLTAAEAVAALVRRHGAITAEWTYPDASGTPVGIVVRWDRVNEDGEPVKDFRPIARHADGWRLEGIPEPRPLYRRPELIGADRVFVCEGEKAADAVRSLGLIGTTSPHGAKSAAKADWTPLAGRDVVILPDNDDAGRKYAKALAGILGELTPPATLRIVELPGVPEKGDVVEWIESHGEAAEPDDMRAELELLVDSAEPVDAEDDSPPATDRYEPFPVVALPDPVRKFVRGGAEAIGCDASYIAMPTLAVLATAIGMTRRLRLYVGWEAPAIVWAAVIGESGTSKTPAHKLALKALRAHERKLDEAHAEAMAAHEAELAHAEKAMNTWQRDKSTRDDPPSMPEPPTAERCIVGDTTVEALAPILSGNPRGVLLERDELSGWLGSFDRYVGKGGGDAAHWLSMHSGDCIPVDRKTGNQRRIRVPTAAVSVCGGIQPGVLHRALGQQYRENGLAARLLLAAPPRKVKRWTEAEIDPASEAEMALIVGRLFTLDFGTGADGETCPVVLTMTPEAKAAWVSFYDSHNEQLAELTGELAAAFSKLEEYAARLALIVHCVRWAADDPTLESEDMVDAVSMAAGITLTAWFKREARRVYAMLGEGDDDRKRRQLIELIERKGGSVTAREVQQSIRSISVAADAEAALEELAKAGCGSWEPSPPGRGRPTRRFRLSTVYENRST